ncbi:MAG: hypothetical protein ACLPZJ_15600, partial [Terriglobales bacterium]
TIYPLGLGSGYDTDFHDITSSSNGYPAVTGYDLATGWGSPNGTGLINALAGRTGAPTPTPTAIATKTATPTATATHTPTATATTTATPTATPTARPTATATASASSTPTLTATATPTGSPTPTPTSTAIPTATPTTTAIATFFNGEISDGNGISQLTFPDHTFFGYYSLTYYPFLYHYGLGWEYVYDANDGVGGVYFYDFGLKAFLYTNPSSFPFLYDYSSKSFLYYYSGTSRYFYDFGSRGLFFSAPGEIDAASGRTAVTHGTRSAKKEPEVEYKEVDYYPRVSTTRSPSPGSKFPAAHQQGAAMMGSRPAIPQPIFPDGATRPSHRLGFRRQRG